MELYDNRERWHEKENIKDQPINPTEVQKYYAGKTVLITGASGFIGTLLIERLLRFCKDVKRVILIVREKDGRSANNRAKDIFANEVFFKMKQSNKQFWKKTRIVRGNCEDTDFGIESADLSFIRKEVDIIFHLAGTTKFEDSIHKAYDVNVSGTKRILELAAKIPHLKALVYTSTVYSYKMLNYVEEKMYEIPIKDEQFSTILQKFDEASITCLMPKISNGQYSSLSLTKAMAENLLYTCNIPFAICRLSSVTPTIEEPSKCWTKNLYGVTDTFIATKSGFLGVLYCDKKCKLEIMPADRAANILIAIPMHFENKKAQGNNKYVPIYNCVGKPKKSITWEEGITMLQNQDSNGLFKKFCNGCHFLTNCSFIWNVKYFFIHILPLMMLSILGLMTGKRSQIWAEYIRWYWKSMNYYRPLTAENLNITTDNVNDLVEQESPEDKVIFNCDNKINWSFYFFHIAKFCNIFVDQFDLKPIKNKQSDRILMIVEKLVIWSFRIVVILLVYMIATNCFKKIIEH